MRDIDYREIKLKKLGLPDDYINVYLYLITRDSSFLTDEYKIAYPSRTVINASLLNKRKEELLLLFGRLLIYKNLIEEEG